MYIPVSVYGAFFQYKQGDNEECRAHCNREFPKDPAYYIADGCVWIDSLSDTDQYFPGTGSLHLDAEPDSGEDFPKYMSEEDRALEDEMNREYKN